VIHHAWSHAGAASLELTVSPARRADATPSLEERLIMRKTLVPCGLAIALLAPLGHAEDHATLEGSTRAETTVPLLPVPHLTPAPAILAQSGQMRAHGGDGDMASFAVGDLVIESPWARESVTRTGAAYLTVRNGGDADDQLIGVVSDVADRAELHASVVQDGVMRMRPVEAVEVPAHGEAVLEPGGVHVMLIGLKAPLDEGGSFALTLVFENAGEVEVVTTIEGIAHGAASHDHD
jgi:copper(I)-binding protein